VSGIHGSVSASYHAASGAERIHGDPCTFILLGATGDLARRKLLGALVDLVRKRLVAGGPGGLVVVAVDREPMDDAAYRKLAREALARSDEVRDVPGEVLDEVLAQTSYVQADLTAASGYRALGTRLDEVEPGTRGNRLFYLAVPPVVFTPIVEGLAASGLAPRTADWMERPWVRLIVEKPFGHSLETARALNQLVLRHFGEHQVFRIDHYLGKETVQNILVFRAANAIFEPVWNRAHIDHVQITCAETVGIESRGKYYESAGVVRDMFQNHLLQLLALTAMELPVGMRANEVRDEKVKVLRAVRPLVDALGKPTGAVRAQYEGYHDEKFVAPESVTPTYAALRLFIDNGRWRGVPFYLRSGKRMARRVSEIAVQFKIPAYLMRGLSGVTPAEPVEPNVLVLRVQPDDGVTVRFAAKIPGAAMQLTPEIEVACVDMTFDYADAFGAEVHPAYETLILDCMIGDATLFTRSDEVEVGWRITDPLLAAWERDRPPRLGRYRTGSWGPSDAEALLSADGFRWRRP
jgi:glucose-6-phosphate 1-dehydrogenase